MHPSWGKDVDDVHEKDIERETTGITLCSSLDRNEAQQV
jgi:hypothetical protein